MKQRFLITGGTGFIGSPVAAKLVERGHFVRVLDSQWRGGPSRPRQRQAEVDYIQGDVRDASTVDRAMTGIDSVIHFAYINGTRHFYQEPELILDVGIRGMLNVLDSCRKHGVGELILGSSSEVYQTPHVIPTDENVALSIPDVLNPRYSYGGGKIACELMTLNWGRRGFQRVIVVRPHNVYGPNMGWEHVIPEFVMRAANLIDTHTNDPVPFLIQGDGTQTRAFIYIDDMVDGFMRVLDHGKHMEIYNVGVPQEVPVSRLAHLVFEAMGRSAQLIPSPAPPGATPRRCPDIAKVAELGFRPMTSLPSGIRKTLDWYISYRTLWPIREPEVSVAGG